MNNPLLTQTLARRREYQTEIKVRIGLGLFIVICLAHWLYDLIH
jgi:hypothetical protein